MRKFLDENGLRYLWGKLRAVMELKQDKLTGSAGQIVGFDANGNPTAQDLSAEDIGAASIEIGDTIPDVDSAKENVLYIVKNAETERYDIYKRIPARIPKETDDFAEIYGITLGEGDSVKLYFHFKDVRVSMKLTAGTTIEELIAKYNRGLAPQTCHTASFDSFSGQIVFTDDYSGADLSCDIYVNADEVLTPHVSPARIECLTG